MPFLFINAVPADVAFGVAVGSTMAHSQWKRMVIQVWSVVATLAEA